MHESRARPILRDDPNERARLDPKSWPRQTREVLVGSGASAPPRNGRRKARVEFSVHTPMGGLHRVLAGCPKRREAYRQNWRANLLRHPRPAPERDPLALETTGSVAKSTDRTLGGESVLRVTSANWRLRRGNTARRRNCKFATLPPDECDIT